MSGSSADSCLSANQKRTFTSAKSRILAAVLMTLVASTVIIPGMTTYLPFILNDQIGIPILLFPFIWTGLFIYCFMAKSALRVWLVLIGLTLIHGTLAYLNVTGVGS